MKCRDCGTEATKEWYWHNANGKKMTKPRCEQCHEDAVRRAVRDPADLQGVMPSGARVSGQMRRGEYVMDREVG